MQRLKTRAQFQAVMAGSTVSRTAHFALHRAGYVEPTSTGAGSEGSAPLFAVRSEPAVGVLLPKRWARRAVTRNTIKRQIHAVSRELESQFAIAAHVVRLRAAFDAKQFPSATSTALKRAVRSELHELLAGVAR